MSQMEPTPSFDNNADADFAFIDKLLPQDQDYDEEFLELDEKLAREERSAAREGQVIDHLQGKIDNVTALQKMFASLEYIDGVKHPTCNHVMDTLDDMIAEMGYDDIPEELRNAMIHTYGLAMVIEQIARSETRDIQLSKADILEQIDHDESFSPEEKDILTDTTELYLASE